jgi:hypothetical protein
MTEEQEKKASPEEVMLAIEGQGVDWYLQNLVSIVNKGSLEFGITLFVEGLIVSGKLVGGKKYFETFAQEFARAYPGGRETKEMLQQAFSSHAEIYTIRENDEDIPPSQFIHLIDSRCFSPGGKPLPNNRGVLWRGKIKAVSGFNLGSLSAE